MSTIEPVVRKQEVTPVDDVRRVREKLSAEFGNDVERLVEHARQVTDEYRNKLGLKSIKSPTEP